MDKSDVMYGKMNDDMFDYLKILIASNRIPLIKIFHLVPNSDTSNAARP